MKKKLQKSDYFFAIAIIAGLVLHLSCIYSADHFADESFYPTIPLRLINGESLVQHEWNVTQFSSLFLYLPVRIWLAVKGSTEGIILFLRYLYLVIHTSTTIGIYSYFRKYGIWAVVASLLFYTQVPNRILSLSYNSLFALFLLALTIILLTLYKKNNFALYIFLGICYGCCCVCNPFFCFVFVAYIILFIVWQHKEKILQRTIANKKTKKSMAQTLLAEQKCALYNRFFSKQSLLWISLGISIIAIVSIFFFFVTGGTISSIIKNIGNLLTDSQHKLTNSPFVFFINKLKMTISTFNEISFNLPFLLPLIYISLFFDKNRKNFKHIVFYLGSSLAIVILYIFGMAHFIININAFALALPFAVFSNICYILTENKNNKLFYCMWLPGVIATIVQYFATGVDLTVCWVLAISNTAGVFFVKDFFAELHQKGRSFNKVNAEKTNKALLTVCKGALCVGLCLQLVFQCYMYSAGKTINIKEDTTVNEGPFAGFHLKDKYYNSYVAGIKDMDIIKERSNPDDQVLIVSQFSWLYLYIERPFASYSAWHVYLEPERLKVYYQNNPDKKPKYIYIGYQYIFTDICADIYADYETNYDFTHNQIKALKQMFNCTQEKLSNGILLTVNE